MKAASSITNASVDHPKAVTVVMVLTTIVVGLLAVLPTVAPRSFAFLYPLKVDTDPENMLPEDEPVRAFHRRMKEEMNLYDMVVVGIINEKHPKGVFNPDSLRKIYALTEYSRQMSWPSREDPEKTEGVIRKELIAPSTVDASRFLRGTISFDWLMKEPPETQAQADEIRAMAERIPFLRGTLISEDNRAVCLYLPLDSKDLSYRVYRDLNAKIENPSRLFTWEVLNWEELARRLAKAESFPANAWRSSLSAGLLKRLPDASTDVAARKAFVKEVNALMGTDFLVRAGAGADAWKELERKSDEAAALLARGAEELTGAELFRLNRLALEAAFPAVIAKSHLASLTGDERYYITGLPVAEDTFGAEMFKQMAISAPVAMLLIFLLMLFFFRKLVLILSPMIVAMVSVIVTMGVLIATGNTVHIMSSMIPIFIVPIAVLDSVHILSDFFDRYQETRDRRKTVAAVMDELFTPMLYTSLTTAVGFASLALTPIPPVQVFGLFIAIGVMVAWLWTVLFIPAYVMLIPEKKLENFGVRRSGENADGDHTLLGRILSRLGQFTYTRAKALLVLTLVLVVVAVWGISRIRINDNPIKWFTPTHPIRVADTELNKHFGGTYMAYLALESAHEAPPLAEYAPRLAAKLVAKGRSLAAEDPAAGAVFKAVASRAEALGKEAGSYGAFFDRLGSFVEQKSDAAEDDELDAWEAVASFLTEADLDRQLFKQPEMLAYVERIQEKLAATKIVGKSSSLADIVKTVTRDFFSGENKDFKIPSTPKGVGSMLFQLGNSHRKDDLKHFANLPDYTRTVIWTQLKSGDNKDMAAVAAALDKFIEENPPPRAIRHRWFGLTYINVIWQDKMVTGMLQAFLGSFLCVFLMMTLLYRSALWGFLSMVPLTITIGLIYGAIGLAGKDYDMPVAVLSSLSLGLAVDYAIHFLSRSRSLYLKHGSWGETVGFAFGEPARAITRNVIVVGVGFLPLLLAPLVPYQTVGMFIAAILLTAGVATLIILPALTRLLEERLFPRTKKCCLTCNCITCVVSAVAAIALVAVNVRQFLKVGWTALTWVGISAIVVMAVVCHLQARRDKCKTDSFVTEEGDES